MKAKLIKQGNEYFLRSLIKDIPSSINVYHKISETEGEFGFGEHSGKLSKQNCDEIFGVVDVEMLAIEYDLYEKINFVGQTRAYKAGFQKAMELNKDKLYTIEDMEEAIQFGLDGMYGYETGEDGTTKNQMKRFIQSLQQPPEIDVEVEMESYLEDVSYPKGEIPIFRNRTKLDKNGCLILKKI
jgi:hypothetical protein